MCKPSRARVDGVLGHYSAIGNVLNHEDIALWLAEHWGLPSAMYTAVSTGEGYGYQPMQEQFAEAEAQAGEAGPSNVYPLY